MQVFVEPQVEIDALHLAIGDPVEPGAELVVHRQADRIPDGLLPVRGPNRPGSAFTSATNFSYQPGNDQLPMTVAGITWSASMDGLPETRTAPRLVTHSADSHAYGA